MPKRKLDDKFVAAASAKKGERVEWFDILLPGFALRVSGPTATHPTGTKSWVTFYRVKGEQKRATLGEYPAMTLADARAAARKAQEDAKAGIHFTEAKRAARQPDPSAADTIENVVDEFMRRYMEQKKRSPRYVTETRRIFDKMVIPAWQGRPIKSITRPDVIKLLDGVMDRGAPIAANRTLAAIRKLFNWAVFERALLDANPAARLPLPGEEESRDKELSDAEIATFWRGADAVPYPWGPFYLLALVTGQRRSEVAEMRWSEIDREEKLWTIPGSRMKAKRAHLVPLSPLALEILNSLPNRGEHVFTTRQDRPISGFSAAKEALDAKLRKLCEEEPSLAPLHEEAEGEDGETEIRSTWRVHDLRRTAATTMARLGVTRFIIGRILAHTDDSVTAVYDRHLYLDEKRAALDTWAKHLRKVTAPKVVPLRRRSAATGAGAANV